MSFCQKFEHLFTFQNQITNYGIMLYTKNKFTNYSSPEQLNLALMILKKSVKSV